MNIISLMPAATEILAALGVLTDLVGRSHECDFPKEVSTLPICSTTAYDCEGDSATIDAQVKKLLDANKSLYTLNIPLIKKLQPDLIVIQDQCAVCAIDVDALEKGILTLLGSSKMRKKMGENSLQKVDILFNVAKNNRALEKIYFDVMNTDMYPA